MKGANLVSRTSEAMNRNKAQGIVVKEEVIIVDTPSTGKDELKRV
jgi:hypothetical protein